MLLTILMLAAAAQAADKTMASDDWRALSITGIAGSDAAGAPLYLRVRAGDLDGDGVDDEAAVRLACSGGTLGAVSYRVLAPRDLATGQASGKRQHKPVTFTKEWGAASPQLSAMKPTYDLKAAKGARVAAASDGWSPLALGAADGLCPAASAAAASVSKSRSNIQNN